MWVMWLEEGLSRSSRFAFRSTFRLSVRLTAPAAGRTHTERRLHQLMYAERDYEQCQGCDGSCRRWNGCTKTHVTIEGRGLQRKRCSMLPLAQRAPWLIRQDGCNLNTQSEEEELARFLIAATERRVSEANFCFLLLVLEIVFFFINPSHATSVRGLRLELCTLNKMGLLSDVTRVFRENGLSITRAKIGTRGERATGSFYVKDASGDEANLRTVELEAVQLEAMRLGGLLCWYTDLPMGLLELLHQVLAEPAVVKWKKGLSFH
ncbi:Detected protein of confused Function [Hibiscus syriacus]|uniref:ACT domain-containing protein ACR n=1 Tax=Hibiscus syriacus TaxID=106335 RepID=A0A6A3ATR1_HIBSY|nr:Detected protein of confused Function [Hibiscus syriacus]